MKKLIAGNWKMNLDGKGARDLASAIVAFPKTDAEILICPPFIHVAECASVIKNSSIALGAQDCAAQDNGAFTGDISAKMLKEAGCRYVILGHSERRQGHRETNALVKQKAHMAHDNGLIAIICVGETDTQRELGQEKEVVNQQLEESLPAGTNAQNTVIAYEPVWAIGTGKTALPADVKVMHGFIRSKLQEKLADWANLRILYGGSMKPENAAELLAAQNVDGGLIGGASLKVDQFLEIIKSVKA